MDSTGHLGSKRAIKMGCLLASELTLARFHPRAHLVYEYRVLDLVVVGKRDVEVAVRGLVHVIIFSGGAKPIVIVYNQHSTLVLSYKRIDVRL